MRLLKNKKEVKVAKKAYRVIGSFYYHGPNGTKKQGVLVSPGENLPKLDSSELEKFLTQEKICEVDDNGENVVYKKLKSLSDESIHSLVLTGPKRIMQEVNSGICYSHDMWAKVYREAEKYKVPQAVLDAIENKLK